MVGVTPIMTIGSGSGSSMMNGALDDVSSDNTLLIGFNRINKDVASMTTDDVTNANTNSTHTGTSGTVYTEEALATLLAQKTDWDTYNSQAGLTSAAAIISLQQYGGLEFLQYPSTTNMWVPETDLYRNQLYIACFSDNTYDEVVDHFMKTYDATYRNNIQKPGHGATFLCKSKLNPANIVGDKSYLFIQYSVNNQITYSKAINKITEGTIVVNQPQSKIPQIDTYVGDTYSDLMSPRPNSYANYSILIIECESGLSSAKDAWGTGDTIGSLQQLLVSDDGNVNTKSPIEARMVCAFTKNMAF